MSVLILPFVPSDGHYSFDTPILDATYTFDVRWNQRDEAWYFDISNNLGEPIVRGVKIVLGPYLGRNSTHKLFQQGVISAIDTTGQYEEATFDDLGVRVEVRYYPLSDLANEIFSLTAG